MADDVTDPAKAQTNHCDKKPADARSGAGTPPMRPNQNNAQARAPDGSVGHRDPDGRLGSPTRVVAAG